MMRFSVCMAALFSRFQRSAYEPLISFSSAVARVADRLIPAALALSSRLGSSVTLTVLLLRIAAATMMTSNKVTRVIARA